MLNSGKRRAARLLTKTSLAYDRKQFSKSCKESCIQSFALKENESLTCPSPAGSALSSHANLHKPAAPLPPVGRDGEGAASNHPDTPHPRPRPTRGSGGTSHPRRLPPHPYRRQRPRFPRQTRGRRHPDLPIHHRYSRPLGIHLQRHHVEQNYPPWPLCHQPATQPLRLYRQHHLAIFAAGWHRPNSRNLGARG